MAIVDTDRTRIVLIESEPGAGTEELTQLVAAGHDVARCQEPGTMGLTCRGLANPSQCPLDGAGVDLAVAVRAASAFEVGGDERGVTCALRSRVPVIMISPGGHPYGAAVTDSGHDLVATCTAARRYDRLSPKIDVAVEWIDT